MLALQSSLLSLDPARIAITFAALGVTFHLCIRTIEIDYRIWRLLGIYTATWACLVGLYATEYGLSWWSATARASLAGLCFNTGLFASIAIYRLFFHRLRRFPGPWGAKLSRFYAMGLASKSLQYHLELEKMHRKYGDFVRTGPREISIIRPSAVHAIYGSNSPCLRSTWYSQVSDDVTKISLNSTRDVDVHRRRRRAWDRGFSIKALATYEPRVRSKVDVLISQLRARIQQPVDITQWTMYLTFDVMGLVGFDKDFHQLEDAAEHSAIKGLHDQMSAIGILSAVPWLLSLLGSIPGLSGSYGLFMNYCAQQVEEKKSKWRAGSVETPTDVISWLLKAKDENDQSAPPGDKALDEDGRLIIIAGSDTTGVTLANALYYLASNPTVYRQLQKHVDEVFPSGDSSFSYDKVRDLPYLEAIINETLRLKPAVPSGQPRVTPASGLQIDEVWIPGDTNMVVPQYVIQRDERNFPRGAEFLPERWLAEEKKTGRLILNEQAFFPFQIGPYSCVGKQLALMQLRSVLSRIALNFDIAFAPGEDGVAFDQGARDTFTFTVSPLQLVFKERSK
ncbi:hypothetical protein VTN77DRAFT_9212 [Rasamsonia byssochlamydoides]|uniref:uncharacterized protein n=1 Tax=Rasamsonia byssochlamydoides TaxID=89139 RepID=UPI00374279EF